MAELPGEEKQKAKIPVLLGLQRKHAAHARYPRPLWKKQSWCITAGQCGNPVQLDWIHLSRWFFPLLQFYHSIRFDCRRERFQSRTTDRVLHSVGSYQRNTNQRNLRRERATSGTFSNEVESVPECSLLDQPEKCSRQRIEIPASEFQCYHPRQLCASRLSWEMGKSKTGIILVSKDSFVVTSATKGYS